jgi:hypothetical protein
MEGLYFVGFLGDVLLMVSVFLVFYGATRAGAPFEWLLCNSIFIGVGVFYGFEPLAVLSGSGLGFGLDKEGAGTIAIALILLSVLVTGLLSFRSKTEPLPT